MGRPTSTLVLDYNMRSNTRSVAKPQTLGGADTWSAAYLNLAGIKALQQQGCLPAVLVGALIQGAQVVEERAKWLVPVDTGNLRASIHAEVVEDRTQAIIRVGVTREDADYAPHVEFGTYKMRARPYLRPAIEDSRQRIATLAARALNDLWPKVLKGETPNPVQRYQDLRGKYMGDYLGHSGR